RHPGELVLRHQLAGHDRDDARDGGGGRGVDGLDPSVGVRAAEDDHVEHPRQHDVVEIVALAADEARVLGALAGFADAAVGSGLDCHLYSPPAVTACPASAGAAAIADRSCAACLTALTL